MLFLKQIEVFYQHVIYVIKGVSLSVSERQIVCLLGANGAGKSTILKAISGLLASEDGKVTDGDIEFDGSPIHNRYAHEIVNLGIIQVLENRRILKHLSINENLRAGYIGKIRGISQRLKEVYDFFPKLRDIKSKQTGWLSGGEQQMVVIGRALMAKPRIMLLDEPSLGLAPKLIEHIFNKIKLINTEYNTAILLVEQNATRALEISAYGYVMENGRIVINGSSEALKNNPNIAGFYFGLSELGRKSLRNVKHYRRRKRWL